MIRQGNIAVRRRMGRSSWGAVAIIIVLCGSGLLGVASGQGSMESPISRVYNCYLENPENPSSAACKEALHVSGTQEFYDWAMVYQRDSSARFPDGRLCSAGLAEFLGLDLALDYWETTSLPSGVPFTYLFHTTASHPGSFQFYVTRDGYQPTEPLKWADLEMPPFLTVADPIPLLSNGSYAITYTTPPGKSGRHLIYVNWTLAYNAGSYYSCSDVDFFEAPTPAPTPSPTPAPPAPTPSPTPAPTPSTAFVEPKGMSDTDTYSFS